VTRGARPAVRRRRPVTLGLAALLLLAALTACGRYGPPVRRAPQTPPPPEAPAQAEPVEEDEDEEKKSP
jgi:predicted small lipoprotein YifL